MSSFIHPKNQVQLHKDHYQDLERVLLVQNINIYIQEDLFKHL
jgi:hypothetical protein